MLRLISDPADDCGKFTLNEDPLYPQCLPHTDDASLSGMKHFSETDGSKRYEPPTANSLTSKFRMI